MANGSKTPPSRVRKRRSASQKSSMKLAVESNKENIGPKAPNSQTERSRLKTLSGKLDTAHADLEKVSVAFRKMEKRYHCERKRKARGAAKHEKLQTKVDSLKETSHALESSLRTQDIQIDSMRRELEASKVVAASSTKKLYKCRKEVHALRKQMKRLRTAKAALIAKTDAEKSPTLFKLTKKGAFTPQARSMIRVLALSGCSQRKIPGVLCEIMKILRMPMPRKISARTVSRAILEGGIAAKLQLGHEIKKADSFTISADSTSHRHLNYEAKQVTVQAPDYSSAEDTTAPRVRFMGVDHLPSHSSETSKASWHEKMMELSRVYSNSPLARREGLGSLKLSEFASKLMGMNGDHASAEKCTANMMGDWKKEEAIKTLGQDALEEMVPAELIALVVSGIDEKIKGVGGVDAWDALSEVERAEKDVEMADKLVRDLGKQAFEALSSAQQREITLFLWTGCCMHKEQNSFKGGNTAMMEGWKEIDTEPPIVLANKHNAAVLQRLANPASRPSGEISEEEMAALEKSTRGGAKAASIAGAIFNNKDDKKGQGDTYRSYFEIHVGKSSPFPGTNNTRFGSHGEAAIELIKHRQGYLSFMNGVKYRKKRPALTNLEENLVRALQDPPTLTELCVLALYMLSVTFPYMRAVRGPGTENINGLDLGPLHVKVRAHVSKIIDSPELLLGARASPAEAVFNGEEWEDEAGFKAIQVMVPDLPHIKTLLVKFFQGALATWVRFSSEYAPGGLIDGASAEERMRAWMPATNDANEGALGALRRHLREKPLTTIHHYNALAMYRANNTQAWMDKNLVEADYEYLMKEARLVDASKLEGKRKQAQVDHDVASARAGEEKEQARQQREQDNRDRLAKVVLLKDVADVGDQMRVRQIDDQLDVLRTLLPKGTIPTKTKLRNKPNKLQALKEALTKHLSRGTEQGASDIVMDEPDDTESDSDEDLEN